MSLVKSAVFTAMARAIPDQLARPGIHQAGSDSFRRLRAFAWRMAR
jgi:hypothetical protein